MGWLQQVCVLEARECHSLAFPSPAPKRADQQLQTGQGSMVVEHSGQGLSSRQWGLRTREH